MKPFKTIQLLALSAMLGLYACTPAPVADTQPAASTAEVRPQSLSQAVIPTPDPRVGLSAGLFDAGEAIWNLNLVSTTPPHPSFVGTMNSDLAFKGNYVFQGNFNGVMIWDITDPAKPELVKDYLCPASQSDVSVYGDLLFVSGEGLEGRLDCGTDGVRERASADRLRGIRIFDISDVTNPQYVANVQTCRGSHTHSVLKDPDDDENVYIYVSGSAMVRPDEELPGCSNAFPEDDPNSALFRIEVIQVPLADPTAAAIVSSPRIFENLEAPPTHGLSPADLAVVEQARAAGKFIYDRGGTPWVLPDRFVTRLIADVVKERGGEGAPTAEDSAALRERLPAMMEAMFAGGGDEEGRGPNQCHDITLYPEIGLAGGACEGYGLLLDISDPVNPVRLDAVADSNFSYWHSATFSTDGSMILFTDEWGGGTQPKCREGDPMEWGANAIFTITEDKKMEFKSYFKIPAPQTDKENCVAHNGSLIPVPGREIMVQSWYQGGITVFDWSDPSNPVEIAFHDRGPISAEQMVAGGSWSIYWYNGHLVNSEIARGLDIFELKASPFLTQNEIDAAKTVVFDELNVQGQPSHSWPATYALAKAYLDQLERAKALSADDLRSYRSGIAEAEKGGNAALLSSLAGKAASQASGSAESARFNALAGTLKDLAGSGASSGGN